MAPLDSIFSIFKNTIQFKNRILTGPEWLNELGSWIT
jgi:hypothetical protein